MTTASPPRRRKDPRPVSLAKKRGPGRPPLGDAARSRYVPIKLTQAEYEAVRTAAEAAEISVSEYARRRLLGPRGHVMTLFGTALFGSGFPSLSTEARHGRDGSHSEVVCETQEQCDVIVAWATREGWTVTARVATADEVAEAKRWSGLW